MPLTPKIPHDLLQMRLAGPDGPGAELRVLELRELSVRESLGGITRSASALLHRRVEASPRPLILCTCRGACLRQRQQTFCQRPAGGCPRSPADNAPQFALAELWRCRSAACFIAAVDDFVFEKLFRALGWRPSDMEVMDFMEICRAR